MQQQQHRHHASKGAAADRAPCQQRTPPTAGGEAAAQCNGSCPALCSPCAWASTLNVLLCKRAAFTTPCPCLANQVIVSGKLRAQRAKAMKFKDGYMVSSGNPVHEYIDGAVRHVMLRQGVLGIKVRLVGRLVWLGG